MSLAKLEAAPSRSADCTIRTNHTHRHRAGPRPQRCPSIFSFSALPRSPTPYNPKLVGRQRAAGEIPSRSPRVPSEDPALDHHLATVWTMNCQHQPELVSVHAARSGASPMPAGFLAVEHCGSSLASGQYEIGFCHRALDCDSDGSPFAPGSWVRQPRHTRGNRASFAQFRRRREWPGLRDPIE